MISNRKLTLFPMIFNIRLITFMRVMKFTYFNQPITGVVCMKYTVYHAN